MIAQLIERLDAQPDLISVINTILDDTVALVGADFGDVQLLDESECLVLVAQRGFQPGFLFGFRRLTKLAKTACMLAAVSRQATIIENVDTDDRYVAYRDAAAAAGYRAVVSIPLITENQICVGVVSIHFKWPYRPNPIEITTLTTYTKFAADRINDQISGSCISDVADQLFHTMVGTTRLIIASQMTAASASGRRP